MLSNKTGYVVVATLWMIVLFAEGIAAEISSQVIETNRIEDILNYVKPKTLVLLDIDNTLIEPRQTMGSDQWFSWRIEYYQKQGVDVSTAVDRALADWLPVICLTQVNTVEHGTAQLVRRLQGEGFIVMGLTTRSSILRSVTFRQLDSVGIQLSRTAPSQEELIFLNPHEVIYKEGILFTSGTDKGRALFTVLDLIKKDFDGDQIEEVLFINDKRSNLEEVQRACAQKGISFVGLRYGFLDQKVRNFSEELAEISFQHFIDSLSESAKTITNKHLVL